MSRRSLPPSAHDVARLAGVSQAAVSRAFTPGASIAEATRERVFASARQLGYQPNLLARSLITGQSGIVGVIIGNPRYTFFMSTFGMLSARISDAGKHILVYTADSEAVVDGLVDNLLRFRVDALFLMAATISPSLAERCTALGVPIIAFRAARDVAGFSSVAGNNPDGAAKVAEHLLEAGYTRLAFMAGTPDSVTTQERERGFVDHLRRRGHPFPRREFGNLQREGAIEATRRLLSREPRPDAIFCVNDSMALAALEVARFEFGLEIGREIGIAGFDDVDQASWPSFSLTSYALPMDAIVDTIAAFLLDDARPATPSHIVIDGALRIRESTRRG